MSRIARIIAPAVLLILALATLAALLDASAAHAATPEQKCQGGRYKAAAKYTACQQKAVVKYNPDFLESHNEKRSHCRTRYEVAWSNLQAKGAATSCAIRFVDNGDGTVSDNLTGLQWEKKQNLDGSPNLTDPHDADNLYTWSAAGAAADGTAYTSFLAALNGSCFAGQCDWRLPTTAELQTILLSLSPYPCATSPCIDAIFGPTVATFYFSSTSFSYDSALAWIVHFGSGTVYHHGGKGIPSPFRAVRAGL